MHSLRAGGCVDDDVMVPQQFVKDGQIVLNISPGAVMDLNISNDAVAFNGRFGGVATDVYVPISRWWVSTPGKMARAWCSSRKRSTEPPDDTPPDPDKPEGGPPSRSSR